MNTTCVRPPVFLMVDKDHDRRMRLAQAFEQSAVSSKLMTIECKAVLIQYLSGSGQYADRGLYPLPGIILLTLDIQLSDISADIIWLKSTALTRRLPVVILAKKKSQEHMSHLYALGAAGFIVIPTVSQALLRMVRTLDDYWSHCARLEPPHAIPPVRDPPLVTKDQLA